MMPLPDDSIYSDAETKTLAALGLGGGVEEPLNIPDVCKENTRRHGISPLPPNVEDSESEVDALDIENAVTSVDIGPPYSIYRYVS